MPVNARRLIRKMRGGAQAHLIEADDGRAYVVKFTNNPQHRRILVNEWIAAVFLRYLGISVPGTALVRLGEEFLARHPETAIQLGSRLEPPATGWHFGSAYPGDPDRVAVYDFLPDALLPGVFNLREFLGALVFDKWMGNADARQSIFFRARARECGPVGSLPARTGFVALMVDHGFAFDGPHWSFADSPLQGLYFRPIVYENVRGWDDFEPWLSQVIHFPEAVVDDAVKQLPPAWIGDEREALDRLLERLLVRRKRVADLIEDCRAARGHLFPNWA